MALLFNVSSDTISHSITVPSKESIDVAKILHDVLPNLFKSSTTFWQSYVGTWEIVVC